MFLQQIINGLTVGTTYALVAVGFSMVYSVLELANSSGGERGGGRAVKSYQLGLYEKAMPAALTMAEKLAVTAESGYDYLELSIDESDEKLRRLDWTAAERRTLSDEMHRQGLFIRSICLSGHRRYPLGAKDKAVRRKSLAIMEKALDLADSLGVRTIQLAGYDAYYDRDAWEESRAYFQENLCRCVEMAAAWGISLGFETMETPFMNTVSKSMTFVAAVDSPWLGVYPDCGNLTNAAVAEGGAVTADLKTGRGHLLAMHLKPTRPGGFRDMYFDDPASHVDFEADIAAAWALGVRRYVTELWCLDRPDWRANIATARRTMAAILERQEAEA